MQRVIQQYFMHWKAMPDRLPLIVRGVRQVGKSYAIGSFGNEHFENLVVINFEQQREYLACFETLYPQKIISLIYALSGKSITPGKTLLFFDEIQECPNAILALRYFYEQMPELHIMAAGSLLEFILRKPDFRMPVGRIQSCYLKPLSFKEFLMAINKSHLIEIIEKTNLNDEFATVIHEQLLIHIREYLVLGGMPAVINQYLQTQQYEQAQIRQSVILNNYRNDFGKYSTQTNMRYLQTLFEKTPGLIGQHFKYVDVDPHILSRDIKTALTDLKDAGLIYSVHASNANALPLISTMNEKKFKMLFVDVGLVNNVTRLSADILMDKNILLIHEGALAEQFVGQELLAYAPCHQEEHLYYWEREKSSSTAEVDYVISIDSKIYPIEVKAGTTGRLKSLRLYLDEKKCNFGIRVSQNPLSFDRQILSVPLYMISEISRLIKSM